MSELEVKHPEFAKRLNEMMESRGINITKLSIETGLGYEMVRRYTHGYSKPRDPSLKKIADVLNTSLTYLSFGELPKEKPSISDLQSKMNAIVAKKDNTSMLADYDLLKLYDNGYIPVISWVAAGSWTTVEAVTLDDVIEKIPRFPDMSPRAFGLRIRGRSMAPQFNPDDIIYVEPEITPWDLKDGDLVVVQCDGGNEATFKQLVIGETSDDMYLKPLNPDWHEQRIIPMGECTLVGVVRHSVTSY